jgi:hypothetical protein
VAFLSTFFLTAHPISSKNTSKVDRGTANSSNELNKIDISGKQGEEPTVKVPKGLVVQEGQTAFLRDGEGDIIKSDDFVHYRIQKVALGDEDTVYSTWKLGESQDFSSELGADFAGQTDSWIREGFPGKKVGASFAIATNSTKRSLLETGVTEDDLLNKIDADPANNEQSMQIWIVTITKREDGTKLPK